MAFLYNVCTYDSGRYQSTVWDVCCPVLNPKEAPEYTWVSVVPVIDWIEQSFPDAVWVPNAVASGDWLRAAATEAIWTADGLGTAEWREFVSTDPGWTVTPFQQSGWLEAAATVDEWIAAQAAAAVDWFNSAPAGVDWTPAPFVVRPDNCGIKF